MRVDIFDSMVHADIFKGVKIEAVKSLLEYSHISEKKYPADKILMLRGEVVDSLILLVEGRVHAQIQGPGGKILRIEALKAPQPVAAGVMFSNDNRLPVSLLSLTPVRIVKIPKKDVLRLCAESEAFMNNYFTDMGDKISILAEKIKMYQFSTIRQKIASYILGLSGEVKLKSVKLVYSKEVLAEIMGVTRPSLSRELSNLSAQGLIEVRGKTIDILSREQLKIILTEDD